jgi:adenine deaminase
MKIYGLLVDIHKRDIYPAEISVLRGKIKKIIRIETAPNLFIMPGLIDSHIHIESAMITPGAFGFAAVKHGTVGVVSDPHEIANVLGWKGVEFMIRDAEKSPIKFWFGAPSCVPATDFESSGGRLISRDIEKMMKRPEIKYLSEMMNFPGVIFGDIEVIKKINIAKKYGKPIDGHAPGLTGENLKKYVSSGISTDHECSTLEEAEEKIKLGMKILIREGSAAKNLDSLKELYNEYPEMVMLCSDDLHPEMLRERHINKLIAKLINEGFNVYDVIRSATINPVIHYNLEAGLLQPGQNADFIIVDNLSEMNVKETWIEGKKVFNNGKKMFTYKPGKAVNNFKCKPVDAKDLIIHKRPGNIRVIEAFDGELLTKEIQLSIVSDGVVEADPGKDILKIAVKDRYKDYPLAKGFIKGFGLKHGAFASSISHDSHNIIAVGTNDNDIADAINEIVKRKGGLAVSENGKIESLQLNIGGIMTTRSCCEVARDYSRLNELVKSHGCKIAAPFMTLSFMTLLVIPDLKISDRGLFDVLKFKPVPLFIGPTKQNSILQ